MFRTIASRAIRASSVAALRVNRPAVRAFTAPAQQASRFNKHAGLFVVVGLASIATYSYAYSEDKKNDELETIEAKVGKVTDLKDGEMKEVEIDKFKVMIARVRGKYYAISGKCSHFGAPMAKGVLAGDTVSCPWHSAEFSVVTGESLTAPAFDALPTFPVRIEGDDIYVKIPVGGPEKLAPSKKGYLCGCGTDKRVFVVVGAGGAGFLAAQTIRQDGFKGRVVLVTKEDVLPYDRTLLSKQVGIPLEKAALRDEVFYKTHDIEVFRGRNVEEVDAVAKKVIFDDGSTLDYDTVLLATGGAPLQLNIPGSGQSGVHTLRTHADSAAIGEDSNHASRKKAVVIGGSFIGMEAAAALRKNKSLDVTVVAMESVPFERVLGATVGEALQGLHEENGVKFQLGRTVKEITGNGKVTGVVLDNGETIDADLVVMGVGIKPTLPKLKGVNVEKDGGVVVDQYLKVADGVYAAGDIARFPYKGDKIRIEHWVVAQDQGKVAAHNMVGQSVEYKNTPFFWTNQFGNGLHYAGYTRSYDDIVIDGDIKTRKFVAYYIKDHKVVAVCAMGRGPVAIAALQLLKMDKMPSEEDVRSQKVDLEKRLRDLTI
eukprot:Phypoly_transcript_04413.p1 GENE.Phypoly_transcript_04413~~Phypoly_transcript_04413.p1  ORF type:complete len:599 (+),score=106.67 Phypoly_transcript_04413:151-1947(+)